MMAYVIADLCIGVKDTACVRVCPVGCIHPTPEETGFDAAAQLYINPDICIDCSVCASVCPVEAIYAEADLPEWWYRALQRNADYYTLIAEAFQAK
jgi:NAD-dependent dihydropyrimidine dehydrogenase PreA subunit